METSYNILIRLVLLEYMTSIAKHCKMKLITTDIPPLYIGMPIVKAK